MTSILPLSCCARLARLRSPILLVVSALLFCILRLLPVDPAAMSLPPNATLAEIEAKRHEMGLDLPLFQPIPDLARRRCCTAISAPRSISAADVAGLIGSTLAGDHRAGAARDAGRRPSRHRGRACSCSTCAAPARSRSPTLGSIVLLSLPEFLWGLFLILLFGVALELLPFTGRLTAGFQRPVVTGFLLLDTLLIGRPRHVLRTP